MSLVCAGGEVPDVLCFTAPIVETLDDVQVGGGGCGVCVLHLSVWQSVMLCKWGGGLMLSVCLRVYVSLCLFEPVVCVCACGVSV